MLTFVDLEISRTICSANLLSSTSTLNQFGFIRRPGVDLSATNMGKFLYQIILCVLLVLVYLSISFLLLLTSLCLFYKYLLAVFVSSTFALHLGVIFYICLFVCFCASLFLRDGQKTLYVTPILV